jgi:hypothetical protein
MKTQGKTYTATWSNNRLEIKHNGTVVFTMIGDSSAISKEQENAIIQAIAHKINFN